MSDAPILAPHAILVVDDSRTQLGVLGRRLSALGYLVALSDHGREALDLIAARAFDLVLIDMVMPEMNGIELLCEIRGARATADLPAIMMTARGDSAAAVEALGAGADDHIAKPFAFAELAARIERVIARGRRIADLKRANAALDARIATRAVELGETRAQLAATRAEERRLLASLAQAQARLKALGMQA